MESFSTIFDLILKGGGVAVIILILSIISIAIIIEKFLFFLKFKSPLTLFNKINNILGSQINTESIIIVKNFTTSNKSFFAHLVYILVENIEKDKKELTEIIQLEIQQQLKVLEKRMTTLNIIATISPLLGLLGTVIGMISSFFILSTNGGNTSPDLLASGISQALITTAAGLVVAIPSIVFYNYFSKRINTITDDLMIYSIKLIEKIQK